jgi:adenylate cyclase
MKSNDPTAGTGEMVPATLLEAERQAHAGTAARLKLLEQALIHYSPHELLALLGRGSVADVTLGSHVERFMSILFADIRDFTALSEAMTPQQTFDMINSYLTSMSPVISVHHGIIDKYIGDAIMALFPDSADNAVQASLSLLARLNEYNAGRARAGYPVIQLGIGVNTGILMLGMIGSQNRMEGTVISEAVNIAARLESLTRDYGATLLISEHTLYGLVDPGHFDVRYLGRVRVRGKSRGESIYEVFNSDEPAVRQGKIDTLRDFDEAIAYYQLKQVGRALPMLKRIVRKYPGDIPAGIYLARCEAYQQHQVHEDTGEMLQNIEWREDYRIGMNDMDRDHQQLMTQCHDLVKAIGGNQDTNYITQMLATIARDIRRHFDQEEALMIEQRYPFAAEHRNQHAGYCYSIDRLLSDVEVYRDKREYLASKINRLMLEWLVNHTIQVDRHLARYLSERSPR